jgi:hypothetical protein
MVTSECIRDPKGINELGYNQCIPDQWRWLGLCTDTAAFESRFSIRDEKRLDKFNLDVDVVATAHFVSVISILVASNLPPNNKPGYSEMKKALAV